MILAGEFEQLWTLGAAGARERARLAAAEKRGLGGNTLATKSDHHNEGGRGAGSSKADRDTYVIKKINKDAPTMDDQRVAILSKMQTCGIEEWVTGSPVYLTTVKCASATAEIHDTDLIAMFLGNYNYSKLPKTLRIQGAKVFKIRKEKFLAVFGKKSLEQFQEFAIDKLEFLNRRIKYLQNQAQEHIQQVLYQK